MLGLVYISEKCKMFEKKNLEIFFFYDRVKEININIDNYFLVYILERCK